MTDDKNWRNDQNTRDVIELLAKKIASHSAPSSPLSKEENSFEDKIKKAFDAVMKESATIIRRKFGKRGGKAKEFGKMLKDFSEDIIRFEEEKLKEVGIEEWLKHILIFRIHKIIEQFLNDREKEKTKKDEHLGKNGINLIKLFKKIFFK